MHIFQKYKGEILAILACLVGSSFPVFAIFTFKTITPLYSVSFSTLIAAMFFALILSIRDSWTKLLHSKVHYQVIVYSLLIGFGFKALLYLGMRNSSAGNTAILLLMEIFFAFIIIGLIAKKEPILPLRVLGSFFMFIGASIILLHSISVWQNGDFLILLATFIAPIGNIYGKEARRYLSSEGILFCRSLISCILLFIVAYLSEPLPTVTSIINSSWVLILNGFFVFALSKFLWMEGINLIPITVATPLLGISPAITMITAYFVLGEAITSFQLTALPLTVIGIFLVTKTNNKG